MSTTDELVDATAVVECRCDCRPPVTAIAGDLALRLPIADIG